MTANDYPAVVEGTPETPVPTIGVRSFAPRFRPLKANQQLDRDRLWPAHAFAIDPEIGSRQRQLILRRAGSSPLILELGFGNGQATATMAAADPGRFIVACEVYPPGIVSLLRLIEQNDLANILIAEGDGQLLLHHVFATGDVDGVRLFFPDPWPKSRHHKRRLVNPEFISVVADRLAPTGTVHVATDSADYAHHSRTVLDACPLLSNCFDGFAPRPDWRPETKFERRGVALGHEVFDLIYRRDEA